MLWPSKRSVRTCLTFAHNLRRFSATMTTEEGHLSDEDGRTPGERRLARVRHSTQPLGVDFVGFKWKVDGISAHFR